MSGSLKEWSKFSATTKEGTVVNFRIVDMPVNLYEEVVNFYVNYFVKEEAIFKAAGVPKSAEAIEELKGPVFEAANDEQLHIVICYLDKGDDQIKDIAGASIMTLKYKEDPKPEFDYKTDEIKKLFEISYGLLAYYDEMEAFELDRCLSDRGVCVCPDYRGLGIAQELLKVRRMICKEHGISINGAWMTSYGTQKAAERDGWETVYEIQFKELEEKYGVTFENAPPTTKFMIARIQ